MAKHIIIEPAKTYASEANAVRAVENIYGPNEEVGGLLSLRYIVVRTLQGRYYPLFIGNSAIQAGVHFNFNVVN